MYFAGSVTGALQKAGWMQGGHWGKRHLQTSSPNAKTNAIPTGGDPMKAFAMPLIYGEMRATGFGTMTAAANLVAIGRLAATLVNTATQIGNANLGRQVTGSTAGSTTISGTIQAIGTLISNLKIGASPSAIDIADQVWSRAMSPFTTVGTFGYQLKNLTSGGGGGGASAADIADAVWTYVTRTLTASSDPTAAAIAAQVRTELAVELGRIDATISSRLAAAGYTAPPTAAAIRTEIDTNSTKLDVAVSTRLATAGYTSPDNTSISAIKAKTDNLPASPASETTVAARPTLSQIEASTILAKEATVAAKPTAAAIRAEIDANSTKLDATVSSRASQTTVDSIKNNTDLIPAGL